MKPLNKKEPQPISRNYNLNRRIDSETEQFERDLEELCTKYEVDIETESFF